MRLMFWWHEEEGTYVRDIQVLKPEKPIVLPPIKTLKAEPKKS